MSSGNDPLYQKGDELKHGSFLKEFVYSIKITNSSYRLNIGLSGNVFEHQLER